MTLVQWLPGGHTLCEPLPLSAGYNTTVLPSQAHGFHLRGLSLALYPLQHSRSMGSQLPSEGRSCGVAMGQGSGTSG